MFVRKILLLLAVLVCFFNIDTNAQTTKPPVIIIPGLVGSELVNAKTGELVWFKAARSKTDDLRLPISGGDSNANRDNLVPRGIFRRVKVGLVSIPTPYESLIKSLKTGGYAEGDWEHPAAGGFENTFYVFAYDWRRDNVENARILIGKIENLKRKLNRPETRFNVVAHSMGGLIARYAAMYGDADLPSGKITPSWAGAKHFNKIFLVGTPNDGSTLALSTLAAGNSPFTLSINFPFVQNFTKFDFFSIPSIYQLLPDDGNLRAYDDNLKLLPIDIYDAKTWDKYGWNAINDKNFAANFSRAEQQNARAFLVSALNRAKRFHEALNAAERENAPVSISVIGADCKPTLDAIIIRRDGNAWKTLFKPETFRRAADGKIVSAADEKRLMFASGDGIVAKHSAAAAFRQIEFSQCEEHNNLVANRAVQTDILRSLAKE